MSQGAPEPSVESAGEREPVLRLAGDDAIESEASPRQGAWAGKTLVYKATTPLAAWTRYFILGLVEVDQRVPATRPGARGAGASRCGVSEIMANAPEIAVSVQAIGEKKSEFWLTLGAIVLVVAAEMIGRPLSVEALAFVGGLTGFYGGSRTLLKRGRASEAGAAFAAEQPQPPLGGDATR